MTNFTKTKMIFTESSVIGKRITGTALKERLNLLRKLQKMKSLKSSTSVDLHPTRDLFSNMAKKRSTRMEELSLIPLFLQSLLFPL